MSTTLIPRYTQAVLEFDFKANPADAARAPSPERCEMKVLSEADTKQLLDKALLKVTISRQDGRQRQYSLTAKGQKVMHHLRGLREEAIAEIWSVLSEGELRAFTGVNDKLLENMRIYLEREE